MDIQDQLNTAFIVDDCEYLEELELNSSTPLASVEELLNTTFIADDTDNSEFDLSSIDQLVSVPDTAR